MDAVRAVRLLQFHVTPSPDAIVVVKDSDNDDTRRAALGELHNHVAADRTPVVIGVPHTEIECWLLAGFVVQPGSEEQRYGSLFGELSFCPVKQSERLTGSKGPDARDPKRVLRVLTDSNESRVWECVETPFPTLTQNGLNNGLGAFLDDIQKRLLRSLYGGSPSTT